MLARNKGENEKPCLLQKCSKQKKVSVEEQMLHIMQQLQMETTSKDPWKQKGKPLKEAINTREECMPGVVQAHHIQETHH
jgi:hypothetical protein